MATPDYGSADFQEAVAAIVEAKTSNWISDINTSFLLTSGYLVFMMQLGFALLTVGAIQAKSVKSVCLKNLMDVCAGGVGYFLFGYAFAYGDPQTCDEAGTCTSAGNPFIGSKTFALHNLPETSYQIYYFQFVFAVSTATIVSGAVAERVKFIAYGLYALYLTIWVYPVLTHWVWSTSGWASPTRTTGGLFIGSGVYDTVGSGAVHAVGGWAGLAGAMVAGPRMGRFDRDGKPRPMPGHNSVFFIAGVLLLWFGFYGFNPGTMGMIIAADGSSFAMVVARCAMSTTMGACFGGCTALLVMLAYTKFRTGHAVWDLCMSANGALTGMVVITSGCATFEPWAAALGGIVGGLIVLPSSLFVLHVLKVDDPVDAVTVHAIGGTTGVIFYSLMASKNYVYELYGATAPDGVSPRHYGWFRGDTPHVLGANVVWVLVLFGWTMGMMYPFFFILNKFNLLRISREEELAGVDVSRHGGHAYPGMEDVYISELKGLDVTTEDLADKDSAKIDYSLGDIVLQGQVDQLKDEVARLTALLPASLSKTSNSKKLPSRDAAGMLV